MPPDDIKKFEKQLMDYLKNPKLDKDRLRQYSSSIVQLKQQGAILERIHRYGIWEWDGFVVKGRIPIKEAGNLFNVGKFNRFEGFPIGIIDPDVFGFQMTFGNEVDQFESFNR